MTELIGSYRDAWQAAGHPGQGKVMLAFHMMCTPTRDEAYEIARPELNRYLAAIVESASDWATGTNSKDYPGYDKMIEGMKRETLESQVEKRAAWIGSPAEVRDMIADYDRAIGGFEEASLQVNFGSVSLSDAEASMRLFAKEVAPHFSKT